MALYASTPAAPCSGKKETDMITHKKRLEKSRKVETDLVQRPSFGTSIKAKPRHFPGKRSNAKWSATPAAKPVTNQPAHSTDDSPFPAHSRAGTRKLWVTIDLWRRRKILNLSMSGKRVPSHAPRAKQAKPIATVNTSWPANSSTWYIPCQYGRPISNCAGRHAGTRAESYRTLERHRSV